MKRIIAGLIIFGLAGSVSAETDWDRSDTFRLLYAARSVELGTAQAMELSRLRTRTTEYVDYAVQVAGHSDAAGSSAANLQLSKLRAEAVAQSLVDAGIPPDRITTHWYGEARPFIDRGPNRAEPLNRRVELTLHGRFPTTAAPPPP